ncbi:putative aminopeptidase FrvX [Catenibacillus scindens]|uniref:Putative aminopeptidase FrvX n=1 Tax=Catenibacillus scindens TaxID=673271 RepID=A0A7W8M546_9FIRM|nr:M42 family metallopeptidase [Catenibacillus scindens]MBB5263966.1 putative aminopeptidase FrvX [Catenibacillus scindens]
MTREEQQRYMISILERIVNIPSPSGYTKEVMDFLTQEAWAMGYPVEHNNKGGIIIKVAGKSGEVLGLGAHGDTLGAMVRSVTKNGCLKIFPVGGYMMSTIEGEYCKIHCRRNGRTYTGTVLTTKPSVHVYDDCRTQERVAENMEIRIDEIVESDKEVEALGIGAGDYISFDPRFEYTPSGFIKSRHLDDKASVAVLMTFLKYLHETGKQPEKTLKIIFTNYEEIGHGASFIPSDIQEFLAVDMGALGDDLTGNETKVSICAMDSSGPYDYDMTNRLIQIAEELGLGYAVDIFPHYGSDVSAALRGGNNIRGALIGQGVHASHGMERTHIQGMMNTLALIKGYTGLEDDHD